MKTSIVDMIMANPNGLLRIRSPLALSDYLKHNGFGLKKAVTIYQSKKISGSGEDWFLSPGNTLETLFTVREESESDLLPVYVVEVVKNSKVFCHVILSDKAYHMILNDDSLMILQVHQMYSKFL